LRSRATLGLFNLSERSSGLSQQESCCRRRAVDRPTSHEPLNGGGHGASLNFDCTAGWHRMHTSLRMLLVLCPTVTVRFSRDIVLYHSCIWCVLISGQVMLETFDGYVEGMCPRRSGSQGDSCIAITTVGSP